MSISSAGRWDRSRVSQYLRDNAGIQFDPEVVDCFLTLLNGEDAQPGADSPDIAAQAPPSPSHPAEIGVHHARGPGCDRPRIESPAAGAHGEQIRPDPPQSPSRTPRKERESRPCPERSLVKPG